MKLQIENFRSIRSCHLEVNPGLNVLIGPNGSGKSCIIQALSFLKDTLQRGVAQAMASAGGTNRNLHKGQKIISFSICTDYGFRTAFGQRRPCTLKWKLQLAPVGIEKLPSIIAEEIQIDTTVRTRNESIFRLSTSRNPETGRLRSVLRLCSTKNIGRDMFGFWGEFDRNNRDHLVAILRSHLKGIAKTSDAGSDRPILSQLHRIDKQFFLLLSRFEMLSFYNFNPDRARAKSDQLPIARMAPDGSSMAEVIDALKRKQFFKLMPERTNFAENRFHFNFRKYRRWRNPYYIYEFPYEREIYHEIEKSLEHALDHIHAELTQAVTSIDSTDVKVDPTSGKRFVVFRSRGKFFTPEEVSDGTIKWLCTLISIFVAPAKMYILEEPENFLHPWMQQRLIELMRSKPGTIFVLSSHSVTLINAVLPEELILVRMGQQGTEVTRVADRSMIDAALKESGFGLGDVWVSGAIGGVPN